MENKDDFARILEFFQTRQTGIPGDPDYNAGFCHSLVEATSAEESSIWQLDAEGRLHLVCGTNVAPEEVTDVNLHQGEGISGAAVLSRQTIVVSDAWAHPQHDRRVDERIDFRTHAMASAPILFDDMLYGVINILNHASGGPFPVEWQERLSAVGAIYAAALASADRLSLYDETQEKKAVKNRKGPQSAGSKTIVVGVSRAVQEALHLCLKAGKSNMPVLVHGETGTGKELAARRIHEAGNRASGPYLDVNCAALAETLLESELFGHVKGTFSGANRDRKGKFFAASGGTLFLDEIGEMSLACQAKILRALQEKNVTPVGSEKALDCDARIIAATNHDLWAKVERKEFREDLFYRLCGIEIFMPPLRERVEDIPILAMHFLNRACAEQRRQNPSYRAPRISNGAIEMIKTFNWPGNVRQLEQAVSAAVAICEGDAIGPNDFPPWLHKAIEADLGRPVNPSARSRLPGGPTVPHEIDDRSNRERARYMRVLDSTKYMGTGRWNLSAAARELGIPRKTLYYRLKKLRLIK